MTHNIVDTQNKYIHTKSYDFTRKISFVFRNLSPIDPEIPFNGPVFMMWPDTLDSRNDPQERMRADLANLRKFVSIW